MAIKERLLKQLNIVRDGLNTMPPFHSRDLNAMRNALVQARDLCFQGLPSDRVSDYQDVYDGLLLAADQLAEGAADGQEIASLCQDLLQYLLVQTQKETSFKKEIVFLPYQASMWDSLESVWKAANEDKEHCNAYVIPIPYCDRNPDMTSAQWHCERDMFPKYVPTLDWQEVNLEEWHPDVIFIHNAYDDRNAVTSVDSSYYSRNLKKCTDKLVYIPYAVEEEVQPGNEAIEEAISHRVLQPGVLNADLVIAQSEDTRQAWINILVRHTNMKDRNYWENRILGLGSPKIDKVLTSKREDFDMPEKWRKLIEGKKVILYNTSLGAMLQNSDKVCDKLRYVFDIFRNRDDVVLWWRPHPLMKSTFHSMRPQFEEEYLSIEKQYIEEGWGIYDDSPDLHRAICWSDAYYGDWSSVILLYKRTGKPLLIQQIGLLESCLPHMEYVSIYQDEVWFVGNAGNWQGLFRFDVKNKELCCLGEIPAPHRRRLEYVVLERINKKILIAPYFSTEGFIEYDIENQTFLNTNIGTDIPHDSTKGEVAFSDAMKYENSIFFFANHGGKIIEYNNSTEGYHIHTRWKECLPQYLAEREICIGRHCCQLVGDKIFFVIRGTNLLVQIDMTTMIGECYIIPPIRNAWRVQFIQNELWILPQGNESLLIWSPVTKSYRKIKTYYDEKNERLRVYGLVSIGEDIITLPYMDSCVCIFQPNGANFEKDAPLTKQCVYKNYVSDVYSEQFAFVTNADSYGRIFAYNILSHCLFQFSTKEGSVHQYRFPIADGVPENILGSDYLCQEYSGITLDSSLNSIVHFNTQRRIFLRKHIGEMIYHRAYKEISPHHV